MTTGWAGLISGMDLRGEKCDPEPPMLTPLFSGIRLIVDRGCEGGGGGGGRAPGIGELLGVEPLSVANPLLAAYSNPGGGAGMTPAAAAAPLLTEVDGSGGGWDCEALGKLVLRQTRSFLNGLL